ncbi:MAG TPA: Hpt domain-containing protein [Rhizomicrobium sp.]|nr:Hpt domain-containing protein [Rhizomicrobium sp.]
MSDLATQSPIDLSHLARYTGGERQLNCEVFRLFSDHCARSLQSLAAFLATGDRKGWRDTAHALKGAASGIGAFALAESAGIAEGLDPEHSVQASKVLATLAHRSEVVLTFIEAYLASE